MKYEYGMRLRGFSIGCQPMEGLVGWKDCKPKERYHSILIYNRKLSEDEVRNYDLDYIGEAAK